MMHQCVRDKRMVRKLSIGHATQKFQIAMGEGYGNPTIGFYGQGWYGAAVLRNDESAAGKFRILIADNSPFHAQDGQKWTDFTFRIEFAREKTLLGG